MMPGEIKRNRIFLALLFSLGGIIGASYLLPHTFSAILTSVVIAYLLNPLLKYLEQRGFKRLAALGIIYVTGFSALFLGSFFIVPFLGHQMESFIHALPAYIKNIQTAIESRQLKLADYYGGMEGAWLLEQMKQVIIQGTSLVSNLGFLQLKKVVFAGFNLILAPILVFFMLLYKQAANDFIKRLFHHHERQHLVTLGGELNRSLERFLIGMFFDCLIVGILTSIALALLGIDFPILNGFFTGFASIIPLLGPMLAVIPPALIGYANSHDIWIIPQICAVYFIINVIIEGNLIKPLVMRHTLRLNPLAVIFAVMAMGELLGFWGIILAIPTAAVVKICTAEMRELLLENYR